jgi:hypothetical protein
MELPEGLPRSAKNLIQQYLDNLTPGLELELHQVEELKRRIIECLRNSIPTRYSDKEPVRFVPLGCISSDLQEWSEEEDDTYISEELRGLAQSIGCLCNIPDGMTCEPKALKPNLTKNMDIDCIYEGIDKKMWELADVIPYVKFIEINSTDEIPLLVNEDFHEAGDIECKPEIEIVYSAPDGKIFKVKDKEGIVICYVVRE